ncbi:MAG: hypothetical protein ACLS37_13150 [Alistipes sp.]
MPPCRTRCSAESLPGNLYQHPTTGVGLIDFLHGNFENNNLAARLQSEFGDNMVIINAYMDSVTELCWKPKKRRNSMGKYVVTEGQNLYDIALHLTGSIEGIVDLLICNPVLSLADTLRGGDELFYTDDFVINADVVARYRREQIVPAGGERNVYPKHPSGPRRLWFTLPAAQIATAFSLPVMVLRNRLGRQLPVGNRCTGFFRTTYRTPFRQHGRYAPTGTHKRDFTLQSLDLSASGARRIRLPEPLHCERFSLCGGSCPLEFAPLLDGVFRMDLSRHSCGHRRRWRSAGN